MVETKKAGEISDGFKLITDPVAVDNIESQVPAVGDYEHLWVKENNGEYTEIWGGYGVIPYDSDTVYRVI